MAGTVRVAKAEGDCNHMVSRKVSRGARAVGYSIRKPYFTSIPFYGNKFILFT